MMEHENTKEARRKLQEYKQKLGKEFFVEFFHRSLRFSYDNNYFIGVLDHITWTNRCSSAYFIDGLHQFWSLQVATYSHFTPISLSSSLAWFCCFNCYIFSLALLKVLSFFLVVQEVSKESQELMRKALEEVTLTFLPNFTFPFCGLKDAVDGARLSKKDLLKKERIDSKFSVIFLNQEKECYKRGDGGCNISILIKSSPPKRVTE